MQNGFFGMTVVLVFVALVVFPSPWAGVALIACVVAFVVGEHAHKHAGYPCYAAGRHHLTIEGAIVLLVSGIIVLVRVLLALVGR